MKMPSLNSQFLSELCGQQRNNLATVIIICTCTAQTDTVHTSMLSGLWEGREGNLVAEPICLTCLTKPVWTVTPDQSSVVLTAWRALCRDVHFEPSSGGNPSFWCENHWLRKRDVAKRTKWSLSLPVLFSFQCIINYGFVHYTNARE
jgi:hypothetical protein